MIAPNCIANATIRNDLIERRNKRAPMYFTLLSVIITVDYNQNGRKIYNIKCVLQVCLTMHCKAYVDSSSTFDITFDKFTNQFDAQSKDDEVLLVDKWIQYLRRFSLLTKCEPISKVYHQKVNSVLSDSKHRVFVVHLSLFVRFMLVEIM